jgi:hypothetical protein
MASSSPVGWQYLVTEDEETENIRLHELTTGEDLGTLLDGFKEKHTKATVLINTNDSYEVAENFVGGVKEVPFPVLVVQRTDGEEILRCLERHPGDSIHARVDAENQVDGEVASRSQTDTEAEMQKPDSSICKSVRTMRESWGGGGGGGGTRLL